MTVRTGENVDVCVCWWVEGVRKDGAGKNRDMGVFGRGWA